MISSKNDGNHPRLWKFQEYNLSWADTRYERRGHHTEESSLLRIYYCI